MALENKAGKLVGNAVYLVALFGLVVLGYFSPKSFQIDLTTMPPTI